jgi:hypothetical protein
LERLLTLLHCCSRNDFQAQNAGTWWLSAWFKTDTST